MIYDDLFYAPFYDILWEWGLKHFNVYLMHLLWIVSTMMEGTKAKAKEM